MRKMLSYIFQKSFVEHEHFYFCIVHWANLETNFHVSEKKKWAFAFQIGCAGFAWIFFGSKQNDFTHIVPVSDERFRLKVFFGSKRNGFTHIFPVSNENGNERRNLVSTLPSSHFCFSFSSVSCQDIWPHNFVFLGCLVIVTIIRRISPFSSSLLRGENFPQNW